MALTRNQLNTYVDTNVTDKTAIDSLTPTDEGESIKKVADYVDDNFALSNDLGATAFSNDYNDLNNLPTPTYKSYVVAITQTSTGIPTMVIYENSVGSITATRSNAGDYNFVSSGLFTNAKTWFNPQFSDIYFNPVDEVEVKFSIVSTSSIRFQTLVNGSQSDGILTDFFFELRVYN